MHNDDTMFNRDWTSSPPEIEEIDNFVQHALQDEKEKKMQKDEITHIDVSSAYPQLLQKDEITHIDVSSAYPPSVQKESNQGHRLGHNFVQHQYVYECVKCRKEEKDLVSINKTETIKQAIVEGWILLSKVGLLCPSCVKDIYKGLK